MIKFPNLSISEFWVQVSKLATGTVLAQITGILLTPFITRIFSASDIGILSIFNQVVGILVVISVLRLDRALVLAQGEEATRILKAGVQLIIWFTLFLLVITVPFGKYWFDWFSIKIHPIYILAVPLGFFLQSFINLFKSAGNTFTLYGMMASAMIIQSILIYTLKIGFGLGFEADPFWLILAEIIAAVFTLVFLTLKLNQRAGIKPGWLENAKLKAVLSEQKVFLKYDVPAALLNYASWSIPTFLLAYYFDAVVVGYYALGFTMLRLPMNLLGKAIGDVFYKKSASNSTDISKLRISSSTVVILLFSFGILPIAAVYFFGDVLFSFFFGKEWIEAGKYSQILSIWTLVWFVSSPISNLYYVLGLQKSFLRFMITSLVVRALAIAIGAQFFNPGGTLVIYSIASLFIYGYQVIFLLGKVETNALNFFKNLWISSRFAVLPLIAMAILNYLSFGTPIMMAILIPIMGVSMAFRWFSKPKLSL